MLKKLLGLGKKDNGYGSEIYTNPMLVSDVLTKNGLYLGELVKEKLVLSGRTLFTLYHEKKTKVFEFYKFEDNLVIWDETILDGWELKKSNRRVANYCKGDLELRIVWVNSNKVPTQDDLIISMDLNVFSSLFDPNGKISKRASILKDIRDKNIVYNFGTFIPKSNTEVMLYIIEKMGYPTEEVKKDIRDQKIHY